MQPLREQCKEISSVFNGVDCVAVDLKEKRVTVVYDLEKVSLQTIKDTIEDQGYDVK